MALEKIGILYNARIPRAHPLAEEIGAWAEGCGRQVQICAIEESETDLCFQELDLLVTLGGDGSILRAAHLAAPHGTLILGVNLGRVGFLTEAEPTHWEAVLSRALAGEYWVEERMMLQVTIWRAGEMLGQAGALNDVVVGRGAHARAVHLRTEVDGGELTTYVADGLIVATPTGSTAYALAAGGPILPPQLRNILLVPAAAHLSMERPIVLAEGVKVRITVVEERLSVLTVDGQVAADLKGGDVVEVEAAPHVTRFARLRERTYFYETLVNRLAPRDA